MLQILNKICIAAMQRHIPVIFSSTDDDIYCMIMTDPAVILYNRDGLLFTYPDILVRHPYPIINIIYTRQMRIQILRVEREENMLAKE